MSVRFFYVDESWNDDLFCLSAISIRHSCWHDCFDAIKAHRAHLAKEFGIHTTREIHTTQFVSGRGRYFPKEVGRAVRAEIYEGLLHLVASLPKVHIFNVCLNKRGLSDPQLTAWERLLNRVERTLTFHEDSEIPERMKFLETLTPTSHSINWVSTRMLDYSARAVMVADQGKEPEITRSFRRMRYFNHIPSKYGHWEDGGTSKNIPLRRVIEDPVFKRSEQSFFVQMVDWVVFALLKQEATPTPNIERHQINTFFAKCLSPVLFLQACPSDPQGVVRK